MSNLARIMQTGIYRQCTQEMYMACGLTLWDAKRDLSNIVDKDNVSLVEYLGRTPCMRDYFVTSFHENPGRVFQVFGVLGLVHEVARFMWSHKFKCVRRSVRKTQRPKHYGK